MHFEVTCFDIGFENRILKIRDIYVNSEYLFNQNISQDSRNSGEFLWHIVSRKVFSNLVKLQKKRQRLPKLANINQLRFRIENK